MSAVLKDAAELASMRERDLAEVMAIEGAVYSHPWSRGNFADSLRAGYECRTLRLGTELIGYFILMVAAGEAHLLNLSIAATMRMRSEEHTSELQSHHDLVCRLLLEKKKNTRSNMQTSSTTVPHPRA